MKMKKTRIFMAALTAALLLAACGQETAVSVPESVPASSSAPAGSTAESSSVSEISAEEPSSAESEPEEIPSGETEEDIVRYATSTETDGIDYSELVCLLLPEGENIRQVFETEERNYLLLVQSAEGKEYLRLISAGGELLKELPMLRGAYMGWVFQEDGVFIYDNVGEDGTDIKICYDRQLNELEPEESIPFAYSLDYSEDGKYLQLLCPDGSRENLAETGAESYEEVTDGAGFYHGYAGKYESYSSGGRVSGIVNLETGESYTFTEDRGVKAIKDMGEYIVCTSQGLEGGRYPSEPYVYQFYPETEELKRLALPYGSWPVMSQGNCFAYELYFGRDEQADARAKAELMALAPGLTEEELDTDSVLFVVDAETLQIVRYYAGEQPATAMLSAASPDWEYLYYAGNYDMDGGSVSRPRVYKLPMVTVRHS